jgi:CPA2 family monovalent cation:H+ antiporter-2/glutathione-regulated potassium-efflux system protein KefB
MASGLIDGTANAVLTATIILSMALTPVMVLLHDKLVSPRERSMEGVELAENLTASVLLIGFGRFGQIVSQPLFANGWTLSLIETDTDMIRDAADFGFKVHYGDGSRLDILHAAGAQHAQLIVVAVNDKATCTRIVELLRSEFPLTPVLARAWDREHSLQLIHAGVEFQIRETVESALLLGAEALRVLGVPDEQRAQLMEDVRERDRQRLAMEVVGGLYAGRSMVLGNAPQRPHANDPRPAV